MKFLIIVLTFIFAVSCAPSGTNENLLFQDITLISGKVSFNELKTKLLVPQCVRCHAWAQDEVAVNSRIVVGIPAASPLFIQVSSGRMPQGGPPVAKAQLALLEAYIKGGGDGPQTPPPELKPTYASLKFHLFDKSCTMCHNGQNPRIPDLRSYARVTDEIEDVLSEIDIGSMPPRDQNGNARAPMPSDEVINVLNQWVRLGMPQ